MSEKLQLAKNGCERRMVGKLAGLGLVIVTGVIITDPHKKEALGC